MRGARLELAHPLGAVDFESILGGKDPTPRAKSHNKVNNLRALLLLLAFLVLC